MNPLVSVIITTYARPTNLVRAITSVLNQTYHPIEIIVIDDNGLGTPYQVETRNLLKSYIDKQEIQYYAHKVNKNGSAARNTGVKICNGIFIALLDDDDVFYPEKIERQVNTLIEFNTKDNLYQGCYCNTERHRGKHKDIIYNNKNGNITEDLLLQNVWFNTSTLLLYKDAYKSIGGFDERFLRHQDWEFTIRFLSKFKLCIAFPEYPLVKKYSDADKSGNVIAMNMKKYIEIKKFFLSEMSPYINILPSASRIYHLHWYQLSVSLFRSGLFKDGYFYLKRSNTFGRNSIAEYISIIRGILYYIKRRLI